jgi:hypothetical protein
VSAATVSRVLKRAGLSRLKDIEPAEPVRRYERRPVLRKGNWSRFAKIHDRTTEGQHYRMASLDLFPGQPRLFSSDL